MTLPDIHTFVSRVGVTSAIVIMLDAHGAYSLEKLDVALRNYNFQRILVRWGTYLSSSLHCYLHSSNPHYRVSYSCVNLRWVVGLGNL